MPTPVILVAGLTIVIGGILAFRLHAFVALILAGLTVAVLTPSDRVTRSAQLEAGLKSVVIDRQAQLVLSAARLPGSDFYVVAADQGDRESLEQVGRLNPTEELPVSQWSGEIPFRESNDDGENPKKGPFCYRFEWDQNAPENETVSLQLISQSKWKAAADSGKQSFMSRLTSALGSYCGQLAILIVAASIIGRCLLDSGAADRIVRSAVETVGEKNAPAAFVASGFTLSIPVFFDTVFYLMIPLGKALRMRTGKNYLLYVLAIVAGGTMAHSLVPPTPGPLFIAEAFGVSLGAMILGGCVVGLFSSSVAMLYAFWANGRFELALPEAEDTAAPPTDAAATPAENPESPPADPLAVQQGSPGLFASLTPILLPVLLITLGALVSEQKSDVPGEPSRWTFASVEIPKDAAGVLKTVGEKNFALLASAIIAVLIYVQAKRPSKDQLSRSLQDAVSSAGTIILVTAAGGAFGRMMRQTSVAELLQSLTDTGDVTIVIAAFLVTTAVRTAQGSSTVAMITAAGIFGSLVTSGAANVDPLYVALAVGCGSKPIAWMNDSGFWVITRMSGMTEKEGLKYITPMTALAGVAGLVAVIIGVKVIG